MTLRASPETPKMGVRARRLFRKFTPAAWGRLRDGLALPLTEEELAALRGRGETIVREEAEAIYMPVCRLLHHYIVASQNLASRADDFLGRARRAPYVIAVVGSVAVGKSTTARILRAALASWLDHPRVDIVASDGFLLPNDALERRGLMQRKGWPESYDSAALARFLQAVKSGAVGVKAPVYSHDAYDVLPDQARTLEPLDVLIVEGLNLLQPPRLDQGEIFALSDCIDFAIYLDADPACLEEWYVARFQDLRRTAFRSPAAYFHRFARLNDAQAEAQARTIWRDINLPNLRDNIAPTRERASLVLAKDADHGVEEVLLRKI